MEQYIKKSALVAEIENLENTYKKCPTRNSYEDGLKDGRLIGYKDALYKINTLSAEEEPVSEDLLIAARRAAVDKPETPDEYLLERPYSPQVEEGFIKGANWQKQQDQETIELAEDHAMLAGMVKGKEETIRKACDWITEINNHYYIMRYSDSCEVTSKELIEWFKNYMEE